MWRMATVSRHASETVESTYSNSSSTVPLDSLQDMSDAALLEVRDQARSVESYDCVLSVCLIDIACDQIIDHVQQ